MGALDRWRALSGTEKKVVLEAAPMVAAALLRLRLLGMQNALRWSEIAVEGDGDADWQPIAAAVDRVSRYLPGSTCLTKSLALARLLRKKGAAANVRIGVKADPDFEAHAWVEVDGESLQSAVSSWQKLAVGSSQSTDCKP